MRHAVGPRQPRVAGGAHGPAAVPFTLRGARRRGLPRLGGGDGLSAGPLGIGERAARLGDRQRDRHAVRHGRRLPEHRRRLRPVGSRRWRAHLAAARGSIHRGGRTQPRARRRPSEPSSATWCRSPIAAARPRRAGPSRAGCSPARMRSRTFGCSPATDGPGVWLPDFVATPLRAEPGDQVILRSDSSEVRVAVDGVYASLYTQPRQGYWRLWNDQIYPCPDVTCAAPPQFILADLDRMLTALDRLGVASGDVRMAGAGGHRSATDPDAGDSAGRRSPTTSCVA